jgi:hypothetical protein
MGANLKDAHKWLQKKLESPCFDFGWIPEFRVKKNSTISYEEEEQMAFDNLSLVIKNYARNQFANIIVTDLRDPIFRQIPRRFSRFSYALFTLFVEDETQLKERVLDESRSSGYRDWEEAIKINQMIVDRPLMKYEVRLDSGLLSTEALVEEIVRRLSM